MDEYDLRNGGRNLWPVGAMMALASLGLLGVPPFATFYGQSQIHAAAVRLHLTALAPVPLAAEAVTAAALLRFTARVFLGWGRVHEASSRGSPHIPMDTETAGRHDRTPLTMWLPAVVLLVAAATVAIPGWFRAGAAASAEHFTHTGVLAAVTLDGAADRVVSRPPPPPGEYRPEKVVGLLAAVALAGLALFPWVLGRRLNGIVGRGLMTAMRPLRTLQSGNVGDYVAWFTFGMAAYAGLLLLLLLRRR